MNERRRRADRVTHVLRCLMFWRRCPYCRYVGQLCFDDVRKPE